MLISSCLKPNIKLNEHLDHGFFEKSFCDKGPSSLYVQTQDKRSNRLAYACNSKSSLFSYYLSTFIWERDFWKVLVQQILTASEEWKLAKTLWNKLTQTHLKIWCDHMVYFLGQQQWMHHAQFLLEAYSRS